MGNEERIARVNKDSLVRIGKCVYGADVASAGSIEGAVIVQGGETAMQGDVRRELSAGDTVTLRELDFMKSVPVVDAATTTTTSSSSSTTIPPTIQTTLPTIQTTAAPSPVWECVVVVAKPLIIRPILAGELATITALSRSKKFRCDASGSSRIVYNRQVQAVGNLAGFDAASGSGSAGGNGNKGGSAKKSKKKMASSCCEPLASALIGTDQAAVANSASMPFKFEVNISHSNSNPYGPGANGASTGGEFGGGGGSSSSSSSSSSRRSQPVKIKGRQLNDSQAAALAAATSQRLTLIQGPPGTGKTAVSIQVIGQWVGQHRNIATVNEKVFAGSDSNIAVDNLLEGLVSCGINAVRIGRPETASPHLLRYCVEEIAKEAKERVSERNTASEPRNATDMAASTSTPLLN